MFRKIMVPVDLAHADRLDRALRVAADLARLYDAEACYVAVTAATPGPLGRNPMEFETRLKAFADAQAARHGHRASALMVVSHDPATELDDALRDARETVNADLVVMASHVPGVAEYLFPAHGGKLASHAKVSVMVVRE